MSENEGTGAVRKEGSRGMKEGPIKKPAIGMDGDSQPARSGGGKAILSQEGPLTEVDKDEAAWKELMNKIKEGGYIESEAAKEIFLERCAESAIEAVRDFEKEDEKRRAALEKIKELGQRAYNLTFGSSKTYESELDAIRALGKAIEELDALTPAPQENIRKFITCPVCNVGWDNWTYKQCPGCDGTLPPPESVPKKEQS